MPSVLRPSVFWKEILGCVLIKSLCRMVKVENVEKQGARFPTFSRFSTYLMGVSVPLCTCVPFRVFTCLMGPTHGKLSIQTSQHGDLWIGGAFNHLT
jgi:hypothetical protein